MDDAHGAPSSDPVPNHGRLDSWKQIATYLGRGVTTVQRWEQEGLPVRRLPHAKKGSVFAYRHEIDAWLQAREQSGVSTDAAPPALQGGHDRPGASLRAHWRPAAVAVGAAALVLTAYRFAVMAPSTTSASTAAASAVVPRPIANDEASEAYPSLSPDGDRVVYFWNRPDAAGLYIKDVGGAAPHPLGLADRASFRRASFPKWSPRGDLIAFLAPAEDANPDVRGVYVVTPSGGNPRQLATISGTGLCWAPDGETLAFNDRSSTGEPFSIFALSLSSGVRRRLTTPRAGTFGDTRCAFSPDGSRLAVSRYATRYQADVYVIQLGRGPSVEERLTFDQSGIHGVAWSPDGGSIAFGTHNGLWTIPAAGSTPPSLIIAAGVREVTFAAPSGRRRARLVYHHGAEDVNIWRWDAAEPNPNPRKIAPSTTWEDHPAISPDNRRVAFASNRTGANEIWVAAADGSDARQLTFYNGPVVISPRWSPDGRRLAFSSHAGGNRDVYVIDMDGSRPTRLTWEASQEDNPSWSRDGRWIYFRSDRDGVPRMWRMPAGGGVAAPVTSGPGSQGFESLDGKLFYFIRSMDVPGLWSIPTAGGTETFVLPEVREAYWDVAETGVAFLNADPKSSPEGPTIRFFDFRSRALSTLVRLPTRREFLSPGFGVSPDARSVVWSQTDAAISDLMLIDPWPP